MVHMHSSSFFGFISSLYASSLDGISFEAGISFGASASSSAMASTSFSSVFSMLTGGGVESWLFSSSIDVGEVTVAAVSSALSALFTDSGVGGIVGRADGRRGGGEVVIGLSNFLLDLFLPPIFLNDLPIDTNFLAAEELIETALLSSASSSSPPVVSSGLFSFLKILATRRSVIFHVGLFSEITLTTPFALGLDSMSTEVEIASLNSSLIGT
mmetsp:Transcript_56251/g.65706  ORF Transcript_56251/g.65706 Transcript_56251/m.65706 type:complete len:213 (+) Transcript_56251:207-845(+)